MPKTCEYYLFPWPIASLLASNAKKWQTTSAQIAASLCIVKMATYLKLNSSSQPMNFYIFQHTLTSEVRA